MVPFVGVHIEGDIDYRYRCRCKYRFIIWVIFIIMVPFWALSIIRHLVFRDPKEDHSFDNHPLISLKRVLGFFYNGFEEALQIWSQTTTGAQKTTHT